jgi:hypothetical protein
LIDHFTLETYAAAGPIAMASFNGKPKATAYARRSTRRTRRANDPPTPSACR